MNNHLKNFENTLKMPPKKQLSSWSKALRDFNNTQKTFSIPKKNTDAYKIVKKLQKKYDK